MKKEETLLTKKSLEQSLAPPRSPPHFTSHRQRLLGEDPSDAPYAILHGHDEAHSTYNQHAGLRDRIEHLLQNQHVTTPRNWSIRHPHLTVGPEPSDRMTRYLGALLPLHWQNSGRDSGTFGTIADTLVTCSIPVGAVTNPSAAAQFIRLTNRVKRIPYGQHESNFIDLLFPHSTSSEWTGLVFFVHGGAWGSGKPWFYRLVATPFLEMNLVVAIVGYRVYPYSQDVDGQVHDLECAAAELAKLYPDLCGSKRIKRSIGTCVMGHSSGAHIILLMAVEQAKRRLQGEQVQLETGISKTWGVAMPIDKLVGISGPYDISHHFDYEAARGVEEISPMKAACGYTRDMFHRNSPHRRLKNFLATFDESVKLCINRFMPPMVLIHGVEDETVPFTATSEAARVLRSCGLRNVDEIYVTGTGHQEDIVQVMLGGKFRDLIVDWLSSYSNKRSVSSALNSKL